MAEHSKQISESTNYKQHAQYRINTQNVHLQLAVLQLKKTTENYLSGTMVHECMAEMHISGLSLP